MNAEFRLEVPPGENRHASTQSIFEMCNFSSQSRKSLVFGAWDSLKYHEVPSSLKPMTCRHLWVLQRAKIYGDRYADRLGVRCVCVDRPHRSYLRTILGDPSKRMNPVPTHDMGVTCLCAYHNKHG